MATEVILKGAKRSPGKGRHKPPRQFARQSVQSRGWIGSVKFHGPGRGATLSALFPAARGATPTGRRVIHTALDQDGKGVHAVDQQLSVTVVESVLDGPDQTANPAVPVMRSDQSVFALRRMPVRDLQRQWLYVIHEGRIIFEVYVDDRRQWRRHRDPDLSQPARARAKRLARLTPTAADRWFRSPAVRCNEKYGFFASMFPLSAKAAKLLLAHADDAEGSPVFWAVFNVGGEQAVAVPEPFGWAGDHHDKVFRPALESAKRWWTERNTAALMVGQIMASLVESGQWAGDWRLPKGRPAEFVRLRLDSRTAAWSEVEDRAEELRRLVLCRGHQIVEQAGIDLGELGKPDVECQWSVVCARMAECAAGQAFLTAAVADPDRYPARFLFSPSGRGEGDAVDEPKTSSEATAEAGGDESHATVGPAPDDEAAEAAEDVLKAAFPVVRYGTLFARAAAAELLPAWVAAAKPSVEAAVKAAYNAYLSVENAAGAQAAAATARATAAAAYQGAGATAARRLETAGAFARSRSGPRSSGPRDLKDWLTDWKEVNNWEEAAPSKARFQAAERELERAKAAADAARSAEKLADADLSGLKRGVKGLLIRHEHAIERAGYALAVGGLFVEMWNVSRALTELREARAEGDQKEIWKAELGAVVGGGAHLSQYLCEMVEVAHHAGHKIHRFHSVCDRFLGKGVMRTAAIAGAVFGAIAGACELIEYSQKAAEAMEQGHNLEAFGDALTAAGGGTLVLGAARVLLTRSTVFEMAAIDGVGEESAAAIAGEAIAAITWVGFALLIGGSLALMLSEASRDPLRELADSCFLAIDRQERPAREAAEKGHGEGAGNGKPAEAEGGEDAAGSGEAEHPATNDGDPVADLAVLQHLLCPFAVRRQPDRGDGRLVLTLLPGLLLDGSVFEVSLYDPTTMRDCHFVLDPSGGGTCTATHSRPDGPTADVAQLQLHMQNADARAAAPAPGGGKADRRPETRAAILLTLSHPTIGRQTVYVRFGIGGRNGPWIPPGDRFVRLAPGDADRLLSSGEADNLAKRPILA